MPENDAHPGFPHVAAVMPALDEAESLRRLMPRLTPFGLGQIIVGDNGSTDETARVVLDHGGIVAHEPHRGYGAACWAAMQKIAPGIRVVLFLDADGSDDLSRLADLVQPILDDRADLVIATRDAITVEKGALSTQQRVGNWLATRLIRMRWGYHYRDLGPFRAISKDALDRIQMRDRAFGWTVEMQIRAIQENLRIEQISTHYQCRAIGPSKIGGNIRGSAKAAYWILRTIARHW
jgi:glycosyltransferase involved in cell wall biosynthesis